MSVAMLPPVVARYSTKGQQEYQERVDAVPAGSGQLHVSILGVSWRGRPACSSGPRCVSTPDACRDVGVADSGDSSQESPR